MGLRVIFFIVKHILLEWVWSQFLRAGAPTLEPEGGAGRVCCATYALILDSFWRQTSLARSPYPLFFNIKTISVSIFILFDGYHGYSKSSNFFLPSFTPQLISAQITLLFSHSVVSHSLRPHGLQHNRLPCPSPSPGACSNSCPLSQWCHPTISSSVVPFSSCLQSFPASGFFPMSWLFTSGGPSIGASVSASVLPVNIQDWFPLGLIHWITLQSKGLSRVFSNTTVQKHQFFSPQPSLWSSSYIHTWLLEKPELWLNMVWQKVTGEGNGKPLQHSCLENPMNSRKRHRSLCCFKKFLFWERLELQKICCCCCCC